MSARHPTPWKVVPYGPDGLPLTAHRGKKVHEEFFAVLDANGVVVADALDADTAVEITLAADAALAAPPRNCDRFGSWEEAYLAWMRETQDFDDWGELDGDTHDDAEELWMHWSEDDQNREFCDWLFAKADEAKGGAK